MSKLKELGKPMTLGEFREMTKDYPDEVGFGFRNQPMQSLFEVKYHDKAIFVVFQEGKEE